MPELVAASVGEGGPKLDTAELLRRPDRGLRLLTRDQLGPGPGTFELLQDAENAAANALEALGHKVAGPSVRGLATATGKWRALWRAWRSAWHYIAHRHG